MFRLLDGFLYFGEALEATSRIRESFYGFGLFLYLNVYDCLACVSVCILCVSLVPTTATTTPPRIFSNQRFGS